MHSKRETTKRIYDTKKGNEIKIECKRSESMFVFTEFYVQMCVCVWTWAHTDTLLPFETMSARKEKRDEEGEKRIGCEVNNAASEWKRKTCVREYNVMKTRRAAVNSRPSLFCHFLTSFRRAMSTHTVFHLKNIAGGGRGNVGWRVCAVWPSKMKTYSFSRAI